MLILSQYIARHELAVLSRFLTLNHVLEGAKKAMKGLAVETRPPKNLKGFRFFKVRLGKKNTARMIVFIMTESGKVVPILIRLKKDKVFGMNMAMNNPEVSDQINKNLDHILEDIKEGRYQEFSVEENITSPPVRHN